MFSPFVICVLSHIKSKNKSFLGGGHEKGTGQKRTSLEMGYVISELRGIDLICYTVGNCQRLSNPQKRYCQVNVAARCGEWVARGIDWKQRIKKLRELEGNKETPFDSLISPLPWHAVQLLLETVLLGGMYSVHWRVAGIGKKLPCQFLTPHLVSYNQQRTRLAGGVSVA